MPIDKQNTRNARAIICAISLTVLLAACGGEKSAVQSALRDSLKDPDSAKFGDMVLVSKDGACILVNAKNSLGGYAGWQAFALMKIDNEWIPLIETDSMEQCRIVVEKTIAEQTK